MAAAAHIAEVMTEVRKKILTIKDEFPPLKVHVEIGNPAQLQPAAISATEHLVTLFLYRIEPDHAAWMASPERGMAVKLKVMVNVYGGKAPGSQESVATIELRILSEIVRLFMEQPVFGPIKVKDTPAIGVLTPFVTQGIEVEAQQLSLDMEEINHIWTTQGDAPFRTALIYSFNYGVVVPKKPKDIGPPVLRVEAGPAEPGDVVGAFPEMADSPPEPVLHLGALAFKTGAGANTKLEPSITVAPAAGARIEPGLLLVTEEAEDFDVAVEKLKPADGTWDLVPQPAGPPPALPREITSVARTTLAPGAPLPAATKVAFDNPNAAAVYRISVGHKIEPRDYSIGPVTLVVSAPAGGGP